MHNMGHMNWNIIFYQIVAPAPGMMHILDKPGPCGKFENFQRQEGFPVGMSSIYQLLLPS